MSRRQFIGAAATFVPPLITVAAAGYGEQHLERVSRTGTDSGFAGPAARFGWNDRCPCNGCARGPALPTVGFWSRLWRTTNKLNADIVALRLGDLINRLIASTPACVGNGARTTGSAHGRDVRGKP
jgi:hypothetical protein